MLLYKYFFAIFFTVLIRTVNAKTYFGGQPSTPDPKFETALRLSTGFEYPQSKKLHKMSFRDLQKALIGENEPLWDTMSAKEDIMYCDMVCANLYNLIHYLNLSGNFIIPSKATLPKNSDQLYLNESITSNMLAVLWKLGKTYIYSKPFWMMHMYALYIQRFAKDTDGGGDHDKFLVMVHEKVVQYLVQFSKNWCRPYNKYDVKVSSNMDNDQQILEIFEILHTVESRNDQNSIVLDDENEQYWFSLKNIYLRGVVTDEELWKTLIITFGEQSKGDFELIYDDILSYYQAAKNYYWFDRWILQIRNHQLNVIYTVKTVLLQLMRKYIVLSERVSSSKVRQCHKEMQQLVLNDSFFKILAPNSYKIIEIIKLFTKKAHTRREANLIYVTIISDIDKQIATLRPKNFNLKTNDPMDEYFTNRLNTQNEQLSKSIELSEDYARKVKGFEKISNSPELSNHFKRIAMYLEYLKFMFKYTNLECIMSYIQFSAYDEDIAMDVGPRSECNSVGKSIEF